MVILTTAVFEPTMIKQSKYLLHKLTFSLKLKHFQLAQFTEINLSHIRLSIDFECHIPPKHTSTQCK